MEVTGFMLCNSSTAGKTAAVPFWSIPYQEYHNCLAILSNSGVKQNRLFLGLLQSNQIKHGLDENEWQKSEISF